jgi:hypothetical protein
VDDQQKYRLTGDRLYPLVVELARQAGVEDLERVASPLTCL